MSSLVLSTYPVPAVQKAKAEVLGIWRGSPDPRELDAVRDIIQTGQHPPGLVPRIILELIREGFLQPVPDTSSPYKKPRYVLGTPAKRPAVMATGTALAPRFFCPVCGTNNEVRSPPGACSRTSRCTGCGNAYRVMGLRSLP